MLTPRTNILKGLLRHIYIEEGRIKYFNLSFLGLGLKVTYNSDIFEKLRPPPWIFKCPNLNFRSFFFYLSPLFWKMSKIFPFFNYDAYPKVTYNAKFFSAECPKMRCTDRGPAHLFLKSRQNPRIFSFMKLRLKFQKFFEKKTY